MSCSWTFGKFLRTWPWWVSPLSPAFNLHSACWQMHHMKRPLHPYFFLYSFSTRCCLLSITEAVFSLLLCTSDVIGVSWVMWMLARWGQGYLLLGYCTLSFFVLCKGRHIKVLTALAFWPCMSLNSFSGVLFPLFPHSSYSSLNMMLRAECHIAVQILSAQRMLDTFCHGKQNSGFSSGEVSVACPHCCFSQLCLAKQTRWSKIFLTQLQLIT